MPLGEYLGRRDEEHLSRWHAALMAGRLVAPKCDALTREGKPCRRDRLYGSQFCTHHLRGVERDAIDRVRLERLHREFARTSCVGLQRRIERQLRNIERRMLHRAWLNHPEIEGSTLELSIAEEQQVRSFLRDELHLNIDRPDPVTKRELSPRAVDRARWCAYRLLRGTVEPEAARRRVVNLLRDERQFWARQAHDLPR
jgi:hypothetical protein